MSDESLLTIERVSKEMLAAFDGMGTMKWDGRFETVLIEFSSDDQKDVRVILDRFFTQVWDESSIAGVKGIVAEVNKYFGGIRGGQLIFTTDPEQDLIFFCAWWPWGNGSIVSIRFAPHIQSLSDKKMENVVKQFQSFFNLV
ncbi:hypothetical protein ACFL49_02555 [Candidatus Omnitrophota bacterium]